MHENIVDCTACEWQGDYKDTDSGHCPECGAETEEGFEVEEDEHGHLCPACGNGFLCYEDCPEDTPEKKCQDCTPKKRKRKTVAA